MCSVRSEISRSCLTVRYFKWPLGEKKMAALPSMVFSY